MFSTPKELLAAFRVVTRDTVGPYYLWHDPELYQFMSQAESNIAQRLLCISDMTSAAAVLDANAGDPTIPLNPSIIRIRSAFWISEGRQRSLSIRTLEGMSGASIFTDTGTPTILITGADLNTARLYPIPAGAGTVQLTLFRAPLAPLDKSSTAFEIPYQYTPALLEWMRYAAYSKTDAEAFEPAKASTALRKFDDLIDQYGKTESLRTGGARDGVVSYGGY